MATQSTPRHRTLRLGSVTLIVRERQTGVPFLPSPDLAGTIKIATADGRHASDSYVITFPVTIPIPAWLTARRRARHAAIARAKRALGQRE